MPPKRSKNTSSSPGKKAKLDEVNESKKSKVVSKTSREDEIKPKRKSENSNTGSNRMSADSAVEATVEGRTAPNADVKVAADVTPSFLGQHLVEHSWKKVLQSEMQSDYFKKMESHLQQEYQEKPDQVFPPKELIFNALNMTPFDKVKVVILGQDPYHDDGQAHGLSFSVPVGFTPPPSLKNIYKELEKDIPGFITPKHGCLENWASQGVLLLNAALTVRAHQPNSHAKIGWQRFTDAIISEISTRLLSGCVFILWGGFAQKKVKLIDSSKHRVIKAAHPSPLSFSKFFGSKCFSETNEALKNMGLTPVNWSL